jgi:hypothetical protein
MFRFRLELAANDVQFGGVIGGCGIFQPTTMEKGCPDNKIHTDHDCEINRKSGAFADNRTPRRSRQLTQIE